MPRVSRLTLLLSLPSLWLPRKRRPLCFPILLRTSAINLVGFTCLLPSLTCCFVFEASDGMPFGFTAFTRSFQTRSRSLISTVHRACAHPILSPMGGRFSPGDLTRERMRKSKLPGRENKGSGGDCRDLLGIVSHDWSVHRRLYSLAFKNLLSQGTRPAQTNKHFSHSFKNKAIIQALEPQSKIVRMIISFGISPNLSNPFSSKSTLSFFCLPQLS